MGNAIIPEELSALAGFAEARFDFLTGWYLAGRLGAMRFGDITTSGQRSAWDRDTRRVEAALGYRLSREVLVKLDWQRTSWEGPFPVQNQLALQLSSVF